MKSRRSIPRLLAASPIAAMALFAIAADAPAPRPLSPEESRATIRLSDPSLTIELVAAEPDVQSPVAAAWDEDGGLYVAEMLDYPLGPGSGRIKLLADRDGDGRRERVTVFADGLNFPNGVLPWNGGILVTAAPDILFLKDENDDGVAETRLVVLTGFGEGNTQLRVNGPSWGADNWIYGANGRSDGVIRRPGEPDSAAVPLRFHDFRFKPESGPIEPVAGFSQFGLPRDDWGRRFPTWNTIPIRHAVLEERSLARNPFLAETATVAAILDPAAGGRVHPISPPPVTYNRESTFYYNASCGATIYRGDRLGPDYAGNALFCEPLMNVVQRWVPEHRGPTFLAVRPPNEADREFIAATDICFRPVNLATGPDGALYVVDMYREAVEHPDFVPPPLRETTDFRRWNDRGRIWRVTRKGAALSPPPKLSRAPAAELIAMLEHPNGWRRDVAQRLLVTRRDATVAPALETMARASESPLGRIHAAWTLDGMGALADPIVEALLMDSDADVRQAAAKLAVGRPGLAEAVAALAEDEESRVRFQAAIAIGDSDSPEAAAALARVAARDADDEWSRLAVLGGLRETAAPFLESLLKARPEWLASPSPGQARLLETAAAILGAGKPDDAAPALRALLAPEKGETGSAGRMALLLGLADGLARAGRSVAEIANEPGASALLDRAAVAVANAGADPDDRARALTLLTRLRPDVAAARVPELLAASQPPAVRSAAAAALAEIRSPALADRIPDVWESIPTDARRAVIAALLGSAPLASRLMEALENNAIGATELTPAERHALRASPDADVARRAEALLASRTPASRAEVVARFRPALDLVGDPERGRALFAANCQTCHARRGEGFAVGPDVSGVASRPPSALLADILDPNAEVSPDYVAFSVVTRDGRSLSGLLAEETASGLKLKGAEGVETSLLRDEVESLRGTGRSLMPEGFEEVLGERGLADVIAFLKQL